MAPNYMDKFKRIVSVNDNLNRSLESHTFLFNSGLGNRSELVVNNTSHIAKDLVNTTMIL